VATSAADHDGDGNDDQGSTALRVIRQAGAGSSSAQAATMATMAMTGVSTGRGHQRDTVTGRQ
jgi:hypothetical protein